MTLIHLMRHGETEWNIARRLQGQADIGLSEAGRVQVRAQRAALDGLPVRVVASDLARTIETAELLDVGAVRTDRRLREIHIGDWEGRPIEALLAEDADAYYDWRFGRYTPPGGEAWEGFRDRIVDALREHADMAQTQDRDLLLICHGGVIRAVLDGFLGLLPERFAAAEPASLSTIRLDGQPELVSYNR
ncbi:histidine phosphatase family protein [Bauldia sp.]|uniref:histidine phosphatase family protein n=1 Tax=Bauldia sp. TaxID=2575872 RepID=UPI003BAD3AF3